MSYSLFISYCKAGSIGSSLSLLPMVRPYDNLKKRLNIIVFAEATMLKLTSTEWWELEFFRESIEPLKKELWPKTTNGLKWKRIEFIDIGNILFFQWLWSGLVFNFKIFSTGHEYAFKYDIKLGGGLGKMWEFEKGGGGVHEKVISHM